MNKFYIIGIGLIILFILKKLTMSKKITDILPDFSRISSEYGMRLNPFNMQEEYHNGIDLVAKEGSPIYAYNSGTIETRNNSIGGKQIIINGKITTGYAHLNTLNVYSSQKVLRGDLIGTVGTTGQTTGAHLHFTYKKDGIYRNPKIILT